MGSTAEGQQARHRQRKDAKAVRQEGRHEASRGEILANQGANPRHAGLSLDQDQEGGHMGEALRTAEGVQGEARTPQGEEERSRLSGAVEVDFETETIQVQCG